MERREFIKKTTLAAGAISISGLSKPVAAMAQKEGSHKEIIQENGKLPKRKYGQTGVELSVIGFGGIVVMGHEQEEANRIVSETFERGVNYYDVAPSYGKGEAEIKLGPALEPYRKDAFLACKTTKRKVWAAKKEFEQSLKRLRTDYFDLFQLHAITDVQKDVDSVFAKGGVMDFLIQAKKEGRIRYLGFSAHSHEAALAAMQRYDFDSILFPVSFATYYKGNFGAEVIDKAKEKDVAILALKMFGRQRWSKDDPNRQKYPKCWYEPITDRQEAKLAMAFTLSQPVTASIPPGDIRLFRLALDLVPDVKPITPEQLEKLKTIASTLKPIFKNKA